MIQMSLKLTCSIQYPKTNSRAETSCVRYSRIANCVYGHVTLAYYSCTGTTLGVHRRVCLSIFAVLCIAFYKLHFLLHWRWGNHRVVVIQICSYFAKDISMLIFLREKWSVLIYTSPTLVLWVPVNNAPATVKIETSASTNWNIICSDNSLSPVWRQAVSEPILDYCQFDLKEHISMKSQSKFMRFHSPKWILKCRLRNGGHFVSAPMC